jgi:hypothetical protein
MQHSQPVSRHVHVRDRCQRRRRNLDGTIMQRMLPATSGTDSMSIAELTLQIGDFKSADDRTLVVGGCLQDSSVSAIGGLRVSVSATRPTATGRPDMGPQPVRGFVLQLRPAAIPPAGPRRQSRRGDPRIPGSARCSMPDLLHRTDLLQARSDITPIVRMTLQL